MTNTIKQKIKMFIKPDLLIIDEVGYRKMGETAAHFSIIPRLSRA
ncbi:MULTISPECIES: ATP-binding protein [Paenibacillus]|nr:ATP-binding protein [Paenibacillus lautus]